MTSTSDANSMRQGDNSTENDPGNTEDAPDQSDAQSEILRAVVAEVERYVDDGGWDTARQMFALVPTADLLAHEPGLLGQFGGNGEEADSAGALSNALTPVEQGALPGDTVADALAKIAWPDEIVGCVLVIGIMVEGKDDVAEGRLAVGVLRDRPGGQCAIRWRHAPDGPVTYSSDLAPELVDALHATFED